MVLWTTVKKATAKLAQLIPECESKQIPEPTPIHDDWQEVKTSQSQKHVGRRNEHHESDDIWRNFTYLTVTLGCHRNQLEPYLDGYFNLTQPASSWPETISRGEHIPSMQTRISQSITEIERIYGIGGLIQALLWANTYKLRSNEEEFWSMVEQSSFNMLEGCEDYLVCFDGKVDELLKAHHGDKHISVHEGECFYFYKAVDQKLEPIPYSDGVLRLGVQEL